MPRVLIATNEPILAKGLEAVLAAGGLEVTGICHDICELFDSVQRHAPDVAILALPILPSTEVVHDLHQLAPRCHFVGWPRLGANDSVEHVVQAINLMAHFSAPEPTPAALVDSACTASQREVVTLLGYGLSNDEIAEAVRTDRASVQKLLVGLADRLGTEDRSELAMFGLSKLKESAD